MATDPYKVLGVDKSASESDIKSAYRRMAKKYHPDQNKGDKSAQEQFQKISAAYDILGDAEKRKNFDQGFIDADGNPTYAGMGAGGASSHSPFHSSDFRTGGEGARFNFNSGGFNAHDIGDIFGSFFGQGDPAATGGGRGRRNAFRDMFQQEDADLNLKISIDFIDAMKGATKKIALPDSGGRIQIKIPEGVKDGQKLKLSGKGKPRGDGTKGDAYVTINIKPDKNYERKGNNIYSDVQVGLHEAVLGATVPVETIHGTMKVTMPRGTSSGKLLKLTGKGIKGGDHYARIKIVLPEKIDRDLTKFMEKWASKNDYNPRDKK